ncbi:IclR family transcriptional regulator [Rhodococcus sp. ACT016]|uniref:IclR family transcriptional regulator n=1 Tax=Rhodococcus sp. ACT016 TaxID=3134808 RepID=UPI003D2DD046
MTTGRSSILERATAIIAAFDGQASYLQIGTIADRSGLPRSTAHRLVDQLIQLGWIVRTQHGYGLGPQVARTSVEPDHLTLRTAAAPLLQALHDETGAVAHLGVLRGDHVQILDKVSSRHATAVPTNVGDRLPVHATAIGKAILATVTPEDADALVPATLGHRTARTITSRTTLHAELANVRSRQGVSYDNEEYSLAVNCVGVPIRSPSAGHCALSLSGRTSPEALVRMAPLLRAAARRVELRLGRHRLSHPPSDFVESDVGADLTMLRVLNTVDAHDWL